MREKAEEEEEEEEDEHKMGAPRRGSDSDYDSKSESCVGTESEGERESESDTTPIGASARRPPLFHPQFSCVSAICDTPVIELWDSGSKQTLRVWAETIALIYEEDVCAGDCNLEWLKEKLTAAQKGYFYPLREVVERFIVVKPLGNMGMTLWKGTHVRPDGTTGDIFNMISVDAAVPRRIAAKPKQLKLFEFRNRRLPNFEDGMRIHFVESIAITVRKRKEKLLLAALLEEGTTAARNK